MFGEVLECVGRGTCECLVSDLEVEVCVSVSRDLKIRAF